MAVLPGGYDVPRYEDRREGIVIPEWRLHLGAGSNTASNTDDGLLIDILTALSQAVDERGAAAYNAGFFNTAVGLELDQLIGSLFGSIRQPARGSVGNVVVYGDAGTVISPVAAPSQVSTVDRGDVYALAGPVTLGFTTTAVFVYGPTTGASTSTTITINGVVYGPSLGIEGTGLEVATNQWSLMPAIDAQIVSKNDPFEDQFGNGVLVIEIAGLWNTTATTTASTVTQYRGTQTQATSVDTGAVPGSAYQMTLINTPATGWAGVVNLASVTPGADEDSDAQYRARHLRTLAKGGTSTLIALQAILLDETQNPGIEFAVIYNNPGSTTDAGGRPPHSFEVVAEGGSEDTITSLIWENHPLGIQTYGLTTVQIDDERAAGTHLISYSRPVKVYIWVDVVITAGEGFPNEPVSDIQNDVSTALNAFGQTLNIGRDVYIDELVQALAIPGTASIVVTLGTTTSAASPKPPMFAANVPIDDRQLSEWDIPRISAVVNL